VPDHDQPRRRVKGRERAIPIKKLYFLLETFRHLPEECLNRERPRIATPEKKKEPMGPAQKRGLKIW